MNDSIVEGTETVLLSLSNPSPVANATLGRSSATLNIVDDDFSPGVLVFSQANFGIVTKMGFWLMPEPEAYLRAIIRVPRYKDLIPLVDILNKLENMRIVTGFPDIATPLLGYPPTGQVQVFLEGNAGYVMTPEHKSLLAKAVQGYSPELEAFGIANEIPYWELWVSFYGPFEVIDDLVALGGRLVVLGTGDPALEIAFATAALLHPGRVAVRIGYDEPLSHLMQAGGDAILIPSRFRMATSSIKTFKVEGVRTMSSLAIRISWRARPMARR